MRWEDGIAGNMEAKMFNTEKVINRAKMRRQARLSDPILKSNKATVIKNVKKLFNQLKTKVSEKKLLDELGFNLENENSRLEQLMVYIYSLIEIDVKRITYSVSVIGLGMCLQFE